MQFDRVVGKIDHKVVTAAEEQLTNIFLELGTNIQNDHMAAELGGDPLIFALIVPAQHIATLNVPTAATDGKRFFWNPVWLATKNFLGIRLTCYHESAHALYMHPQRRGNRDLKLWNIAVDFIVNGMIMEDLLIRLGSKAKMHKAFMQGLGNYCTLEQCIAMFKDPHGVIPHVDRWIPDPDDLPAPEEDRELSPVEKKFFKDKELNFKFFYADPDLEEDMKRPERIYDVLYHYISKCPECGKIGMYPSADKKSQLETNKQEQKDKDGQTSKEKSDAKGDQHHDHDSDDHQHSDSDHDSSDAGNGSPQTKPGAGTQPDQGGGSGSGGSSGSETGDSSQQQKVGKPGMGGGCGTCSGGFNALDFGDTVDQHMDSVEEPEEMAKRISDAMQAAREMSGTVPGSLTDELALLSAPRIHWKDFIRTKLARARAGNSKNDWTKFRTRPLFAGLVIPKRTNVFAKYVCLLDTSASMKPEDMARGVSQLVSLDDRSEGIIVPADANIYWEEATKVRNSNPAELCKVKIIGRGGTKYAEFFDDYEKKVGKADFLIIITDGFLDPKDVAQMKAPSKDVIWLITSSSQFEAPFGRVFDLLA